jgi:hypothetical protein
LAFFSVFAVFLTVFECFDLFSDFQACGKIQRRRFQKIMIIFNYIGFQK